MPSWSELEMSQILECGYFSTVGILALWVIVGYCGLLWVTVGILVSPFFSARSALAHFQVLRQSLIQKK